MPLSAHSVDVYLCAVLICSLGLLSIFLFTLVLTCQYFYRRHRLKGKTMSFPIVTIVTWTMLLSTQHDSLLLSPQPVTFWSNVQKAGTVVY